MTLTTLNLPRKPGLPPDGSPGVYLGWDAEGLPYLFWWSKSGRWWGAAKHPDFNAPKPFVTTPSIVMHAGPVERGEGE